MDNNSKLIGKGHFGRVFLSYNLMTKDRKVAIKVLDKAKLNQDKISRLKD
jgi:serine/threonine protein kinase